MAAVLVELCRRFEGVAPEDAPEDCVSIARVAERSGAVDQAERFARIAAERTEQPAVAFDALLLLARAAIRRKDWANATGLLAGAVLLPGLPAELTVETHLVLARLAEHRLRNFALALHHARLGAVAEEPAVHQRRLARLARRGSR